MKEALDLLATVNELKEINPQLFSAIGLDEEELTDVIEKLVKGLFAENDKIYDPTYLSSTTQAFQPYIRILELGAAALFNLAFASDARANVHDVPVFWPKLEQDGYEPRPSAAFFRVITVLANNLIAIRNLVVFGFDSQAKTLARSHLELLTITLAISVDEALFQDYLGVNEKPVTKAEASEKSVTEAKLLMEKETKHWRRINEKVKKTIRIHFKDKFLEINEGLIDSTIWRYSNLSNYVHAQYIAIAQSTHYRGIQNAIEDEAEYSFGGVPCHDSKETIFQVCSDTWLFIFVIKGLLQNQHGWQDIEKDGSETLTALCLMDAYIISFVKHAVVMQEEVLNLIEIKRAAIRNND